MTEAATTASKLTMTFSLTGSTKTMNINLADPDPNLTMPTVQTAANEIIGKNAFKVDGHFAGELKDAYITTTTKAPVPAE